MYFPKERVSLRSQRGVPGRFLLRVEERARGRQHRDHGSQDPSGVLQAAGSEDCSADEGRKNGRGPADDSRQQSLSSRSGLRHFAQCDDGIFPLRVGIVFRFLRFLLVAPSYVHIMPLSQRNARRASPASCVSSPPAGVP